MWLVGFDVSATLNEAPVMSLSTGFGFFPRVALQQQIGLPLPQGQRLLDVSASRPIDPARDPRLGRLAARSPLLMIDRFHDLRADQATGPVVAEKDVDPSDWFFKAHFFQDPVQPGSLGLEMMLQALQLALATTDEAPMGWRAEPLALEEAITWKYRGQVVTRNALVRVEVEVQEVSQDAQGLLARGEGSLFVDGLRIYQAQNLTARLRRR
jgi:3-hydroxymyristoyl/3-hydroxydecanoyl-(acyl carrier protein) dehydratase